MQRVFVWFVLGFLYSEFTYASDDIEQTQRFETFEQEESFGSELRDDRASVCAALQACDELLWLLGTLDTWFYSGSYGCKNSSFVVLQKITRKKKLQKVARMMNDVRTTQAAIRLLQGRLRDGLPYLPCDLHGRQMLVFPKNRTPGAMRRLEVQVREHAREAKDFALSSGFFLEAHLVLCGLSGFKLRLSDFSFSQIPEEIVKVLDGLNRKIAELSYQAQRVQNVDSTPGCFGSCVGGERVVEVNRAARLRVTKRVLEFTQMRQCIIKQLNSIGQKGLPPVNLLRLLFYELLPLSGCLDKEVERYRS